MGLKFYYCENDKLSALGNKSNSLKGVRKLFCNRYRK
jgi:hypothetical protein